ncbi:hypothetical protein [Mucilaginibacter sp.]|uniref:hypothetical protein n=1 Tax=Mucilaginibacter sp. TaxID=1882438 RepID=UPI003D0A50ED
MRNIYLLFSVFIALLVTISSCQKDSGDVKENTAAQSNLITDSATVSSPANILATTGTLTVKIKDSTYTFDASKDSIAFINVHNDDDNTRYFGITAINKEHTMSFGVSSSGYVHSAKSSGIAGSQFLINPASLSGNLQYSLSRYNGQKDFGNINIEKYNQDSVLAKGTFHTFLAKDDKANSAVYKVEGTFNLKLK